MQDRWLCYHVSVSVYEWFLNVSKIFRNVAAQHVTSTVWYTEEHNINADEISLNCFYLFIFLIQKRLDNTHTAVCWCVKHERNEKNELLSFKLSDQCGSSWNGGGPFFNPCHPLTKTFTAKFNAAILNL